ncbi:hypothetical protein I3842_06G147700 [Carya illinoinensis]|uniref:Uncharacterized protein n=1 Tax=Carya illinoinensis TaxID=32201 RepID=A0A922JIC5_CARIL|nr:hypothetical protein I3842_06G147700 [Carya illinoinensis]
MESQGKTVLVAVDANRGGKGGMEAVNWALKRIVRPRDTVIALGVILESCYSKKSSCFPFLMRIGISGLCKNLEEDEHLPVDIHDYGIFLLELITGKSARCFQARGNGQKFGDWAIPLLQKGSISQVMDHRLTDTSDKKVVQHMANAALCCLKNAKNWRHSMSEVLAVVRGDEFAESKYGVLLN